MERSRLNQARTLAQRRNDWHEVAEIDAKLAEEAARTPVKEPAPKTNNVQDLLAKVNERNRKANMEAVRKAEMAEMERKKKGRKLLAQNDSRFVAVCCWIYGADMDVDLRPLLLRWRLRGRTARLRHL